MTLSKAVCDLQLGDKRVTLNHLVIVYYCLLFCPLNLPEMNFPRPFDGQRRTFLDHMAAARVAGALKNTGASGRK